MNKEYVSTSFMNWDDIKFVIDHKNSKTISESIGNECVKINESIDELIEEIDLSILEMNLLDIIIYQKEFY